MVCINDAHRLKEPVMSTLTLPTAKVFTTGRSQAVRLPKAFRFNTAEVTIERQGDAVILRPKVQTKDEWWDEMEKILANFEGMPEEIERDRSGLSDPVGFD
jgi:antitoxin VapB